LYIFVSTQTFTSNQIYNSVILIHDTCKHAVKTDRSGNPTTITRSKIQKPFLQKETTELVKA